MSGPRDSRARRARPARPHPVARRRRRRDRARLPLLEPLEGRRLLALLGLAQEGTNPDVASLSTELSFTPTGPGTNRFHYGGIPEVLALPDGSYGLVAPASGGPDSTTLDAMLDDGGNLVPDGPGANAFRIDGQVTAGGHTYDGTLLTARATAIGFADTITPDSGEFDVRMTILGGALTVAGGPYAVGGTLGFLIHQPGLKITTFPAPFSFSAFATGLFLGSSDTLSVPTVAPRLATRQPMTQATRPPTVDAVNCTANRDTGSNSVALYDGAFTHQVTDLTIPGRGFDWTLTRTYRSDVQVDGPLGHNWELNYNQRLEVVTAQNLAKFQAAIPGAKIGDVDAIDGDSRDDLYVLNADGTFTPPAGFYSRLVANADGSFTERSADGSVITYSRPDARGVATMASMADPDGDTMRFVYNDQEQLTFVYDTMGRPIAYFYDPQGRLTEVRDFTNRSITFAYDGNGDLVAATSPAVTGTPTGNDFPTGKTERYTYSSGFADPRLNHELLTMTAPNEVADGGPPRVVLTYDTNAASPNAGRVLTQREGGTNENGVPSGGAMNYQYLSLGTAPPGDTNTAVFQTTATDPNGDITQYQFNQINNALRVRLFANRGIRPGDPSFYDTTYAYDRDYRPLQVVLPQGNSIRYVYDTANPDRFQQGNLLSLTRLPDAARGGDQAAITTTFTYEPVFNQVLTMTDPRGNDPSYVPQNGGANTPARYTTTNTYDYQEGTNFAAIGAMLGISASAAQARLAAAGVPMGLGDVNGDGRTDQIAGNRIRTVSPTVNLLPGSNQAIVEGSTSQPIVTLSTYNDLGQLTSETDPEGNVVTYAYYPESDPSGIGVVINPSGNRTTGGYLRQTVEDAVSAPGRDSGTNPTPAAIRTTYQYNLVGDATRVIDGRGIATDYIYNQLDQVVEEIRAAAHGLYGPDPNEPLPLVDFRYIGRFFYDYNDNLVLQQVEDRGNTSNVQGNPPAADLPAVNIQVAGTSTSGNTATTLNDTSQAWTPNQWAGLEVKIVAGTGAGQVRTIATNAASSLSITAAWAITPDAGSRYVIDTPLNPDPVGGPTAFQDTVIKYDILDQPVETLQEVTNGSSPEFLRTRYRYDPNGNQVLTIQPAGNADAAIFDERDLLFRSFRGIADPASVGLLVLLAPTDPTNYDVRGGAPCACVTYRYDLNGNAIESVNGDNNDLSSTAIDPSLGPGNRTRSIRDGFDRLTSVIDSVGDQAVYQYDPIGEVVRASQFGPVGGPSPTSDGPATLAMPVSSLGVIQSANLVNPNLLASTEISYDELGRDFQTSRVLFVNTIPTVRPPDVREGGSDVGLGDLTPGQTQPIPGLTGIAILGRVSDRTEYDRNSRVTFTVQDDVSTARIFYDGVDRAIQAVDPGGNSIKAAYDANDNPIETSETDVSQVAGVAPEVFLTTSYYDSLDRPQMTVDNIGETSFYRYDSRDNLVATADANGPTTQGGAPIPIPGGHRRAFADGARTVNTINAFGNVTLSFYDGIGRRTRQEQILTASGQGDGVHIGASVFGVKNDPSAPDSFAPAPDPSQGDGDGIIRTAWIWDENSNLSSNVDDNGNVTVSLYDDLDRRITEAKGLTVRSGTLTSALILGARVVPTPTAATINDPGTIPAAQLDAQLAGASARINAVAALFPTPTHPPVVQPPTTGVWGYSPNDLPLIVQDENGSEAFTKFDAANRPIAVRTFRNGQHDSFAGDPIFAPNPASIPNNPNPTVVAGTNIQNFQYDGLSRMTSAFDNNDPTTAADDSTVTEAFDSLSRIIEEGQTIGGLPTKVISSAWRADALRSKLTYPDGRAVTYTYDPLDRLKTVGVQGEAQPIALYNYIGVDRVLERLYPQNGTRQTFLDDTGTVDVGYDGLRRPVAMRDVSTNPSNPLVVGFTYTYDRMSNALTQGKLHDPANGETYTYDSAYRLVGFQRAPGGIAPGQSTWALDGVGNWDQVDGQTRQHTSTNELVQESTGSTTTNLGYDNNGNQADDGTFRYTYDAQNRLRTVTRDSDGATIAAYSYDALGRRTQKVVTNSGAQNGTTDYYSDGAQEIEERNGSDAVAAQYVFGANLDEPLVMDRVTSSGVQRLFYHQDALGSVYALTDLTGRVVEGYQYDAYGRQTIFTPGATGGVFGGAGITLPGGVSALGNPFLFTGRRLDAETGLFYYRARYYNADQGRFISRDPLSYANGMNLYEYAGGNPTDVTDPTGEFWGVAFSAVFQAYDTYLYATGQISGTDYAVRTAINAATAVVGPAARLAVTGLKVAARGAVVARGAAAGGRALAAGARAAGRGVRATTGFLAKGSQNFFIKTLGGRPAPQSLISGLRKALQSAAPKGNWVYKTGPSNFLPFKKTFGGVISLPKNATYLQVYHEFAHAFTYVRWGLKTYVAKRAALIAGLGAKAGRAQLKRLFELDALVWLQSNKYIWRIVLNQAERAYSRWYAANAPLAILLVSSSILLLPSLSSAAEPSIGENGCNCPPNGADEPPAMGGLPPGFVPDPTESTYPGSMWDGGGS
jgi:RHS repeat-associated protein